MDILFDVYDSVGEVSVVGATTINFNLNRFMKREVSLSEGEISVNFSSYRFIPPEYYTLFFIVKVSLYVTSGNSRSQSKIWLEVDKGSGFNIISGTDGYTYNRQADAGYGTVTIYSSYQFGKINGSVVKFRIRAQRIVGTSTLKTIANASSFIGMVDL